MRSDLNPTLDYLAEAGFPDRNKNMNALIKTNYNVEKAMDILLREQ